MARRGSSHLKLKVIGDVLALRATVPCLHASGSECLLQSDTWLENGDRGVELPGLLIGRPLEVHPRRALHVHYLQILFVDSVSPHHPKNLKQFVRCNRNSRTL